MTISFALPALSFKIVHVLFYFWKPEADMSWREQQKKKKKNQLESMRCKVLDKWEEMKTSTVKKEIVVYAVTVYIMANTL